MNKFVPPCGCYIEGTDPGRFCQKPDGYGEEITQLKCPTCTSHMDLILKNFPEIFDEDEDYPDADYIVDKKCLIYELQLPKKTHELLAEYFHALTKKWFKDEGHRLIFGTSDK